jgi:hypothetical protein
MTQLAMAATVLGPARKILVISALTKEIEEASGETAADVVGRVLADASSSAIDVCAFDANAADPTRPAGLLHGVAAIPPTAAGGNDVVAAMSTDLANLVAAIGAANIDPSDAVFIAGPREAMIIKLRAGPKFDNTVLVSLGLPPASVACFAPGAVYSGFQGPPQIETSPDIVVHREDTNPLPIVSSPGVVAAPTSGLWQIDCIAIKIRAWAAWAVSIGGAQIVENVSW